MTIFLFSDIRESTRLWEQHGAAMSKAMARHDAIFQTLIDQYGGRILRHRGDGVSAVFEEGQPLQCALAVQKQIAAEVWGLDAPLRVCLAIHAGEAEHRIFASDKIGQKEEYFGPTLNRVARILSAGSGGQILVTPEVLAVDVVPDGADLQDLGDHLLKNLEAPQKIYNLTHPDLPQQSSPPLKTLGLVTAQPPACPYQGLFAFTEEAAPFFFGRDDFTTPLEQTLYKKNLAAIVGPSGSGKSSVMFAGLAPRLRRRPNTVLISFRPGSHAFLSLAEAVAPWLFPHLNEADLLTQTAALAETLAKKQSSLHDIINQILATEINHVLFLIDQFEELYTLCPDGKSCYNFLAALLETVSAFSTDRASADTPTLAAFSVVLTLRADFMGQVLIHRPFANALQNVTMLLGPMNRQELSLAIERPAQKQHVEFEAGLLSRLLDDVGQSPGNLPMLEFALTLLWERQFDGKLTHAAYDAIGQIKGAVARHADMVYADIQTDEQKRLRWIFMQMVQPGEGTEDTRRLATRAEFRPADWEMIQRLADSRLVVTNRNLSGEDTVEVVHETLIQNWQLLQAWMKENRIFRSWQERLRAAMRQWQAGEQESGGFLRGALLAEAEEWRRTHQEGLSDAEERFILDSLEQRDNEVTEEETRRQREMAQLQALADTEYRRAEEQLEARQRLRWLVIGLAIMFLVAVGAATMAVQQQQMAQKQAVTAEAARQLAETEQIKAEQQANMARSRQLAAQSAYYWDKQFDLSVLLSMEANNITNTLQTAEDAALGIQYNPHLYTILHDHTDGVWSVAFSPNGQLLASGSRDDTIIVWDTATWQPIGPPLAGHESNVNQVVFSPDGRLLASASRNNIILWNAVAGEPLFPPFTNHTDWVNSVAFSPDGTVLASAGKDGAIFLWSTATGEPLDVTFTISDHEIRTIAFSPDGAVLASGGADKNITLWNVATGRPLGPALTGHIGPVNRVQFNPDDGGKTLVSASDDRNIIFWDVKSRQPVDIPRSGHTDWVNDLAFGLNPVGASPAWLLASASSDNSIILWNAEEDQRYTVPLLNHTEEVRSVAFSPDGQILASGSADGKIFIWNVPASRYLSGHTDWVDSVAFSPDGRMLLSAGDDNTIRFWDVASGQLQGQPLLEHSDHVLSVDISPDGQMFASGGYDNTVILWNTDTRTPRYKFETPDWVSRVIFSPDGKLLAAGIGDGSIMLWNVDTGQPDGPPLTGHTGFVSSLHFSPATTQAPAGKWLASGSSDSTIILWDMDTRQPAGAPLTGHTDEVWGVAFSPKGHLLASVSNDKSVRLWDADTGQPLGEPLVGHTDQVWGVQFSPNGEIIASAGRDNTIILWDVQSRRPLLPPLTGHSNWVWGMDFSPDGKLLASGSRDTKIILWQVDDLTWQNRACRIANRNLTQSEWQQFFGNEPYHRTCPKAQSGGAF